MNKLDYAVLTAALRHARAQARTDEQTKGFQIALDAVAAACAARSATFNRQEFIRAVKGR